MPGDPTGGLFWPIVTTDVMLDATSDRAWVQAMLDVEASLAKCEEALGILPAGTSAEIAQACDASLFDIEALGRSSRLGGNPVIPLVDEVRHKVSRPASEWVHWGASSQDILDTASMVLALRATTPIDDSLSKLCSACAAMCDDHRSTLMAGRTLLQHALPITFGLKAASWLVAAGRGRAALRSIRRRLPVQLGGAAGTLAAFGDLGVDVVEALAHELGLVAPPLPWHSDRAPVVELSAILATLTGVSSKVAFDVALLMQTEVAEVAEPAKEGRGASSTLPHKRNPVGAAAVSSAHRRATGLLSVMVASMANEHERGVGGWQAEWETLTSLLRLAGGAVAHVAETVSDLEVDEKAMATNLQLTGGVILSERVVLALTPAIGRTAATLAVRDAAARVKSSGRSFADELLDDATIAAHFDADAIAALLDPEGYLGSTGAFIDRARAAYGEG